MYVYPRSAPNTGKAQMPSLTAFAPKQKPNCGDCWQNADRIPSGTRLNSPTETAQVSDVGFQNFDFLRPETQHLRPDA
jgi:hypothetical protein